MSLETPTHKLNLNDNQFLDAGSTEEYIYLCISITFVILMYGVMSY